MYIKHVHFFHNIRTLSNFKSFLVLERGGADIFFSVGAERSRHFFLVLERSGADIFFLMLERSGAPSGARCLERSSNIF